MQETVALTPQPSPSPPTAHSTGPPLLPTSFHTDLSMWAVVDPDIPRDNPVEDKHRRLVRSHRSSPYDRELKPNTKLRDELWVRPAFAADRH
jgi:phosphatidylinositol 3-kinase